VAGGFIRQHRIQRKILMYFDSLHELFYMHGHGFYVWSAYGISFFTLLAMAWHSLHRHTLLRKEIAQQTQE
jgi:heme exporter protein D